MQRSTTYAERSIARLTALFIIVFAFALSASMAMGVSSAYAQSERAAAQLQDVPAPEVADPRPPRDPFPPFGYGGGPREPRDPDLTPRLGDLFDRFRDFILRLFR